MSSILVINAAGRETRVALVENGHIAEFYLERKKDKGIVGNIYKGRVVRVLPGMQAAFVDIGLEKAAFLYVGDVVYDPDFAKSQFELTEGEHDEEVPDVPEFNSAHEEHHDDLEVHEVPAGELAPPVAGGEPLAANAAAQAVGRGASASTEVARANTGAAGTTAAANAGAAPSTGAAGTTGEVNAGATDASGAENTGATGTTAGAGAGRAGTAGANTGAASTTAGANAGAASSAGTANSGAPATATAASSGAGTTTAGVNAAAAGASGAADTGATNSGPARTTAAAKAGAANRTAEVNARAADSTGAADTTAAANAGVNAIAADRAGAANFGATGTTAATNLGAANTTAANIGARGTTTGASSGAANTTAEVSARATGTTGVANTGATGTPDAATSGAASAATAASAGASPSGTGAALTPPEAITDIEPSTAGLTPVSPPAPDALVAPPPAVDAATATIAAQMSAPAQTPASARTVDRGERRAPRDQARRDKHDREKHDKARGDKRGGQREEKKEPRKLQRIEELLKVGQEVVVQASKDPIGTKGARLTSHISIPGRHLVFMPTVDHIGISRRISNEKERRRLREIVERLRPPGTGFIVRTVAENVPQEKLESDIRFLIEVWNEVVRANEKRRGPGLLHPDLDLILRATRDLFAHDVEKLVVDDREEFERIQRFVEAQDPGLKSRVVLHDNEEPIFDAYGIEQELKRATQRKVWLKSGGYLIIDQAEALTAIDVNSGRYVGKKSLEETITKINVEAAREIVYQLRLRNIGGIIICDFIDMEKQQNRDKVFKTLQEALGRDKAKTNVLRISELGLVEMTRKRVRESIGRMLHEDCSYCDGKGYVKTVTTVCYEIFREIRRESASYKEPVMIINCHPDVARMLQGEERNELRHLMDRFNKSIQVKAQPNYHREQFDIYGRPALQSERPSGHESLAARAPAEAARADLRGDRDRTIRDRGGRGGRSGRDFRAGGEPNRAGQDRGRQDRTGDAEHTDSAGAPPDAARAAGSAAPQDRDPSGAAPDPRTEPSGPDAGGAPKNPDTVPQG